MTVSHLTISYLPVQEHLGACIELRDEKLAPAPRKIEASHDDVKYHRDGLNKAKERLKRLLAKDKKQRHNTAIHKRKSEIDRYKRLLEKDEAENKRLVEMKKKVWTWKPPTEDHLNLKEFMLKQLSISMKDTKYWRDQIVSWVKMSDEEIFEGEVDDANWNVAYHEKEIKKKAQERKDGRNDWLDKLYESLEID